MTLSCTSYFCYILFRFSCEGHNVGIFEEFSCPPLLLGETSLFPANSSITDGSGCISQVHLALDTNDLGTNHSIWHCPQDLSHEEYRMFQWVYLFLGSHIKKSWVIEVIRQWQSRETIRVGNNTMGVFLRDMGFGHQWIGFVKWYHLEDWEPYGRENTYL